MDKKMIIIISGENGNLSKAVIEFCKKIGQNFLIFDQVKHKFKKKDNIYYTMLYTSGTNKIHETLKFCQEFKIPFVNGCTDVNFFEFKNDTYFSMYGYDTYFKIKCAIINAHNWDLPIVGWMAAMKKYGKLITFNAKEVNIEESHQQEKTSVPGTAKTFAYGLKVFDTKKIKSERNKLRQRNEWNIPEIYLNAHACHIVNITYKNSMKTTGFYTRVLGREDYAKGGVHIAYIVAKNLNKLGKKIYTIEDLVDLGLFE